MAAAAKADGTDATVTPKSTYNVHVRDGPEARTSLKFKVYLMGRTIIGIQQKLKYR